MNYPAIAPAFIHSTVKRRRDVWYTIGSGNWTDPAIWMSNHGKRATYPGQNGRYEDVYIGANHTVTLNHGTGATLTANNLYVAGTLVNSSTTSNKFLTVAGNLQATGTVNGTVNGITFTLYGETNYIDNYIAGNSTVTYARLGNQAIMNVTYSSLVIGGTGTKYLIGNTVVQGDCQLFAGGLATDTVTMELSTYDIDLNTFSGNTRGIISKTGAGNILARGLFSIGLTSYINFSGNPTVEFRGGLNSSSQPISTGTNVWSFTTASQSITSTSFPSALIFNCQISIGTGITLSNITATGLQINNTLNGVSGTSAFINKGTLNINTAAGSIMTTGTYDYTSFANTVVYMWAGGNVTLPSVAAYYNLTIRGAVTKTAAINTVINSNLLLSTNATYNLSTFNLTVTGTTTVSSTSVTLAKSGAGSVIFIGRFNFYDGVSAVSFTGNPTVEFRGGIDLYSKTIVSGNGNFGTGAVSFTTNSQSISASFGTSPEILFNGTASILGTITLTVNPNVLVKFNQSVNGDNLLSSLVNKGTVSMGNTTQPMTTGAIDISSFANTIEYSFNGNHTLPYTTFSSLRILGTGDKTLSGNTTINGNLWAGTVSTNQGNISFAAFNITVNGTTNFSGNVSESGSGNNYLFVGLCTFDSGFINFSVGNPAIEFKGGIQFWNPTFTSGSGTYSFTTNNQSIAPTVGSFITLSISGSALISGAITVTNLASTTVAFLGNLNGNNAASTFDNRGTVNYQNASRPMATGKLYCNQAANTFIYNLNGAQDIKTPSDPTTPGYKNLTLSVGGVKRLLGNMSVKGIYTLTGPATLNSNGFALTNP